MGLLQESNHTFFPNLHPRNHFENGKRKNIQRGKNALPFCINDKWDGKTCERGGCKLARTLWKYFVKALTSSALKPKKCGTAGMFNSVEKNLKYPVTQM
jgi:hypothetical protein